MEPSNFSSRVAACAALAAFLYQVECCMVTTALPVLSREIAGLAGVISLVPAAYLVGATVAIVPTGRMALQVGFRRMLAFALGLLATGAMICVVASNVPMLLAGRVIQGLGGGAMAATAYGMVAVCVPTEDRRGAMGRVSLGAGLGMMVGTPLGGFLAGGLNWRAPFFMMVIFVGIVAAVMLTQNFGSQSGGPAAAGWGRSLVLGAGAGCAVIAGSLGREHGWLSPEILVLLILAVGIFAGFVWNDPRAAHPLFPHPVWQAKAFWSTWMVLFACSMALGGVFFLVPFYLHEVLAMTVPVAAGWMMVQVAAYSGSALGAKRLQHYLSGERQAFAGMGITLVAAVLFAAGWIPAWGWAGVAVGCALAGMGLGLAFPAVNARCVEKLPESQRGTGSSLLPLGLNLGSAAGVVGAAELREWHLGKSFELVYGPAFLFIIVALIFGGAGLLRSRSTSFA